VLTYGLAGGTTVLRCRRPTTADALATLPARARSDNGDFGINLTELIISGTSCHKEDT
jgi:hypothetical protein